MIRRIRGFGRSGIDDAVLQPMKVQGGMTSEMLRRGLVTDPLLSGSPRQQQQDSKSSNTAHGSQTPTKGQTKR